ncbi:MAG: hypothetical protein L0Z62_28780 [Gemmataceae bacterium]|nr:hypothetical protein [Gemmataceae bacterium]
MTTDQPQIDFPVAQAAIYGVALSLDAFLLNGIPYGVLQRSGFSGVLEKTAGNLLRDLASLEVHAPHAPAADQPKVREALGALRAKCQQLIDLVTELRSFRDLPPQELCSTVGRVPLLRAECVRLIQELEGYFQTPKPFYQSRPAHSTATVNDFLANLDRMFTEEWNASAGSPTP